MKHVFKLIALSLAASILAGCNSTPIKRDPDYAPVKVSEMPKPPEGNGSIYQSGYANAWFEDIKARRVGDILIVSLVEDTEAKHTNSGKAKSSNTTSITNPTLFGTTPSFRLPLPGRNDASPSGTLAQSLSSSSDFSGSGENTQNNELSGSITVMVTEVLPNGYMRVRGEKRVGMTGGNEYIRVSGIVRPADIDTNNTIDSTKIADATLVYVGDGQVTTASEMGWLAKFFISAVFPF